MTTSKKIFGLITAVFISAFCSFNALAQLQIGGWQTHFSYNGVNKIAQTPTKVYALCNGNLFSYDKDDNSLDTYSKLNILSDGLIKDIAYDEETDILVVCYQNLVIDIIKNGKTSRITDIFAKEISGKEINNITFHKGSVYLSCGFGIVAINTNKMEIAGTYIIGERGSYVKVFNTQFDGDYIYALTQERIYTANVNDKNLQDYNHWNHFDLPDKTPRDFCIFNSKVHYMGTYWYTLETAGWVPSIYFQNLLGINRFKAQGNKLFTFTPMGPYSVTDAVAVFNEDLSVDTLIYRAFLKDAVYDDGNLWLAEDSLSLMDRPTGNYIERVCVDGPTSNNVTFFSAKGNNIVTGYGRAWNEKGTILTYDGSQWKHIFFFEIEGAENQEMFNAVREAKIDPKDPRRIFVSTWYGLFEFYDNKFVTRYTDKNSTLKPTSSNEEMVTLENLTFDKEGNLWVVNSQAAEGLHYRDANGKWHAVNSQGIYKIARPTDVFVSKKNGLKVVAAERFDGGAGGICFIKSGSQPHIVAKERTFTNFPITDGSSVTPSIVYCATEDLNGDVWVGSDIGPFVFKNTDNVFASNYAVNRIKLTRKDDATLADYLLANEQINAIAVDGANRKWIGTANSGLYLISADGQKTIHHFTTENSPLTTNSIFRIAINDENGLVYIQTSNGLFSFQSDAADGKEDLNNVHVFPNPVRPDFTGPITVTGLMEDTEVRITDLQGHVVSHGKSNGSLYTWDGYLENGRHASSGVYFVFQTTADGTNANVAKFAIIKR